jgi:hypothetical protein
MRLKRLPVASIATLHLTDTKREHRDSVPGMAHFAWTGPAGTTCAQCGFWDRPKYLPAGKAVAYRCLKACELARRARRRGRLAAVPATTPTCRYFEPRGARHDAE